MKTKLLFFFLGVFALVAIAAQTGLQLQNYPQRSSVAPLDLVPFSQNLGGGSWQTANITPVNLSSSLASLGGYGVLNQNNLWTAGGFHQGPETFIGGLTLPIGPVNSVLRIGPTSVITYVTLGSNLNMDGNGVLSATFSVATNNISLPLTIANGGTGSTTASAALLGLGAARLDGTTQFPNLLDQGPASNQVMVLEELPAGQQFTAIGNAPSSGYYLGWTNATPGVAWFPNPGSGGTNTGVTTTTGYTNTNPFTVEVSALSNGLTTFAINDGVRDWVTYASVAQVFEFELGPGWSFRGSSFLPGNWHAKPQ